MRVEVPTDENRLNYSNNHCWQYDIRIRNLDSDLTEVGLSFSDLTNIRLDDFEFESVESPTPSKIRELSKFIEKHEWLGKVPARISHRFTASYKGRLAGVLCLSSPNQWSRRLKHIFELERLITRGACISWSPKNLASKFIMWSLRWTVEHTPYRIFTGYSDPRAKEVGTIYQACNFSYLGQKFGADRLYFDTEHPEAGWFSERKFSTFHQIKTAAERLGIFWSNDWNLRTHVFWEKIPEKERLLIKQYLELKKTSCLVKQIPLKHKYLLALGKNRREQKALNQLVSGAYSLYKEYPKR